MVTAEQFRVAIASHLGLPPDELDNEDIFDFFIGLGYRRTKAGSVNLPGIGLVEREDEWGGEGCGDDCGIVFSVNGKQYFGMHGFYSSSGGHFWEDAELAETSPKEVVVIRWT